MSELEEVMLKRSMGESIAILRRYTEIERYGVTQELRAYDDLVAIWYTLFPDPNGHENVPDPA
jgi:hypothetical protein